MRAIRAHEVTIELPRRIPVGSEPACSCDQTEIFYAFAVMLMVLIARVMRIQNLVPGVNRSIESAQVHALLRSD
jgi:hypothetical protein